MQIIAGVAHLVVLLYILVLLARLVIDWIQAYAPVYRPRGIVLVLFSRKDALTVFFWQATSALVLVYRQPWHRRRLSFVMDLPDMFL